MASSMEDALDVFGKAFGIGIHELPAKMAAAF
jgi:hypothetical protein